MASIIKVDRILDSTELGAVEIPIGIETGTMNATQMVSDTWKNVDGTENYKCKCWVNFDGTTTPPTVRASGNVSSVVRNSAGNYTINFNSPMPDINYSVVISSATASAMIGGISTRTTTTCAVSSRNIESTYLNASEMSVAIFH